MQSQYPPQAHRFFTKPAVLAGFVFLQKNDTKNLVFSGGGYFCENLFVSLFFVKKAI